MKVMLTGSTGQIGSELVNSLADFAHVIQVDRDQCDLSKPESISEVVREIRPDVIVNAAAYTAVDQAEDEIEIATTINSDAVSVLAKEAKKLDAMLVHYSTDYVFDGTKKSPYTEEDVPNPINVYGKTKLAGEEAVRSSGCSHLIFRTSWVHSIHGKNFVKTMLRLASEHETLQVVSDQLGAPTSASLIASVTKDILSSITNLHAFDHGGIYNLTSKGETTWCDYARMIFNICHEQKCENSESVVSVNPIPTDEYPTPAKRPLNSRLDTAKIETTFGVALHDWKDGVAETLDRLMHCSL